MVMNGKPIVTETSFAPVDLYNSIPRTVRDQIADLWLNGDAYGLKATLVVHAKNGQKFEAALEVDRDHGCYRIPEQFLAELCVLL